jgi:hypothetical protein
MPDGDGTKLCSGWFANGENAPNQEPTNPEKIRTTQYFRTGLACFLTSDPPFVWFSDSLSNGSSFCR